MKLYLSMEGGLCQGVSSDDPAMVGVEYVIIDYDVDGVPDSDTSLVVQPDGSYEVAAIGRGKVDLLAVTIKE